MRRMRHVGPRTLRRWWIFHLILLGLAWIFTAQLEAQGPAPTPPAPPAKSPLDEPLAWLQEGRRSFAEVRDYTCTLVKRENLRANNEENIILAKFRNEPFSVSMRWLAPRKYAGQEVCYYHGRNNNKLRVHAKGLKKLAGFVSISHDDPRLQECSRHSIYEAGIGGLIEQTHRAWETDRKLGGTQVKVAEYNFDSRRCLRVETTHLERRAEFPTYRHVVYLDKDTKLPVRGEVYDWPRAGGPPEGELIEMASYVDLRFNVGVPDSEFNK